MFALESQQSSLSFIHFSVVRSVLCHGPSLMFHTGKAPNNISILVCVSGFSDWQLSVETPTRLVMQIAVEMTNLKRDKADVKKMLNVLEVI